MALSISHRNAFCNHSLQKSPINCKQRSLSRCRVGIGNHSSHDARFHGIDQACSTEIIWCRGCIRHGSVVLVGRKNPRCRFTRRRQARGERIKSACGRIDSDVYAPSLFEFVGEVLPREQVAGERSPPAKAPVVCGNSGTRRGFPGPLRQP